MWLVNISISRILCSSLCSGSLMCCNLFKEMLDSFSCVWSWEVCFHPKRVAALHLAHTQVPLLDREMQTRTLGPKSAHVFRASVAIGWGEKQVCPLPSEAPTRLRGCYLHWFSLLFEEARSHSGLTASMWCDQANKPSSTTGYCVTLKVVQCL